MARSRRPFNPKAIRKRAVPALRPQLGPDTVVYRYTVFVPVEQIKPGSAPPTVASADDLQNLQLMMISHFGGVTLSVAVPSLLGAGARDPRNPRKTLELNKHPTSPCMQRRLGRRTTIFAHCKQNWQTLWWKALSWSSARM